MRRRLGSTRPAHRLAGVLMMVLLLPMGATLTGQERAGADTADSARLSLVLYPKVVEPGGILEVTIRGAASGISAEGAMGDEELIFHEGGRGQSFFSLAGIDLEAKPGSVPLTVYIRTDDGKSTVLRDSVIVVAKAFSVQRLTIEEKPYTPERLERIDREKERFQNLWKQVTPSRYWTERFGPPLHALTVTSDFGLRRVINDVPRSPHTGVDLRAAVGDTIFATNGGKVVLRGDFYFNGKTIVLDHGEGLYSMYFHLSRALVDEGQMVTRGQPIGLVGSTGRATGPHLHWGIILRGARLDPLKILDLPI